MIMREKNEYFREFLLELEDLDSILLLLLSSGAYSENLVIVRISHTFSRKTEK